jgi:hypothetical protein
MTRMAPSTLSLTSLQIILLWMSFNLHLSNYLLLMFNCAEAQQQQQFIHATATLSQARGELAAVSLGELVFFAGGATSFTSPND